MPEVCKIFIGFDSSQEIAYDVLAYSIRKHASRPVEIVPIKLGEMEKRGFYRAHDPLQSTEFTYTRFLVPWLCGYKGTALFMDLDMIALEDVTELFNLPMDDYALRAVKHDHRPKENTKMGGRQQTSYPRKNWSSLFLCRNDRLRCWSKENVETRSGAWLHRFQPIRDEQIGEINGKYWNVLDEWTPETKLLHLTSGGPWLKGCEDHSAAELWIKMKEEMIKENLGT